ncbi:TlpA family protein disulfide reductase [Chitinophaga filiformis]|nr:TlpA disulfide reductase family protein [Chitinophaga filiformis]
MLALLQSSIQTHAQTSILKTRGNQVASIQVIVQKNSGYDSLQIDLWKEYLSTSPSLSILASKRFDYSKPGTLKISDFSRTAYFALKTFNGKETDYLAYFPISPGDHVNLIVSNGKIRFTGIGSDKMNLAYELEQMESDFTKRFYRSQHTSKAESKYSKIPVVAEFSNYLNLPLDSLLNLKLALVQKRYPKLSQEDKDIFKANTITQEYKKRLWTLVTTEKTILRLDSSSITPLLQELYNNNIALLTVPDLPGNIQTYCPDYSLIKLLQWKFGIRYGNDFPKNQYDIVKYANTFRPALRDKLLTEYMLNRGLNKLDTAFTAKAMQVIQNPDYLSLLSDLNSNLTIGKPAYDFSLENAQGKLSKLSDFKGKVVFLDFWFTGCLGCTAHYKYVLSKVEQHFKGNPYIAFISISVDVNRKTWIESVGKSQYTDPEGINLYTQGKGLHHDLIKKYNIQSFPTFIIIDKNMKNVNINNGIKRWSEQELIAYLENLIKVRI